MMTHLFPDHSYTEQYKDKISPELNEILNERDTWFQRKSVDEYQEALQTLPDIEPKHFSTNNGLIEIGEKEDIQDQDLQKITDYLNLVAPWRKGPFKLFDTLVDAEWRSDWKWQRLENALPDLEGKKICDIGCNNGFYLFHMMKHNPSLLIGIDPIPKLWFQYMIFQKYTKFPNMFFEMLGAEHIQHFQALFDVVFCMGILYHRKSPLDTLKNIHDSMSSHGCLIVESAGIPGDEPVALTPESTYGKAKNVFFMPTTSCLENWLKKTGFEKIERIYEGKLSFEEQRKTQYCQSQSLEDFTCSEDPEKTIEGYPSPIRIILKAYKKR